MTTTQRKPFRAKKASSTPPPTVLVDTQDATEAATEFVYAVTAALGLNTVDLTEADEVPKAAHIQITGNTLSADSRRWHYPDHEAKFERWLVSKCFPRTEHSTAWAVVQTSTDTYPLLAAAMAYAVADEGVLLIDADAAGTVTAAILDDTEHAIEVLGYDLALPSPHIYVLNAPRWAGVAMMLQVNGQSPLNSILIAEAAIAAQYHYKHVVINCGADLFMAQRLAAEGVQVVHLDDFSRPLYVDFEPYKKLDYAEDRIPDYGTRRDFEFIYKNTRRRKGMRRWMERGETR